MTDNEFEIFMTRLERQIDRDIRGATPLGRRYTPRPDPTQHDHTADVEFHRYNQEPWKE